MPNRLTAFLIIFVLSVFLAGCKIGPNYKQPKYELGNQFRFSPTADTGSFADSSWTILLQDTVLKNLIHKGLTNNFDLKIAYERVNEARAAFKTTRADLFPSIGFDASAAYQHQQTYAGTRVEYHDFYGMAQLSWELDIWGKLRRAKESARAKLFAQESYTKGVYIALIAEIATNYFNLIEFNDELQITQYNVRLRKEALELVKAKLIAGTVSGLVVAQAEAELASVQAKVPVLEHAVGVQENTLKLLIGELPGQVSTGDTLLNQVNMNIIPSAGIPSRLILRRPDIIAQEQILISANAEIGVARGLMLPSIQISAGIGYSHLGAGMIGTAMGSLLGPIFNFNKLRSNVRRAQAYKEEMLLNYQKTIYSAINEASDGILNVEKQKEIVIQNLQLLTSAQLAFDLSNQLFNAGYASYLDVLDAQRNLYTAQIYLSQSRLNYLLSTVSLYKALGGGWK